LEGGAAGDRDNRDHKFSALRAARYPIHEILPIFSPTTSGTSIGGYGTTETREITPYVRVHPDDER
jgi:hypothetical protein